MANERPSWDEIFLELAETFSKMATCPRLHVGACVVRDKHVLSLGFNGAPSGHPHCTEAGCLMVGGGCLRTRHAELNAVMQCIERKINLAGTTVYVTHSPCEDCARALIREGVKKVVFRELYRKTTSIDLLKEAGIKVVHLPKSE